MRVLLLLGLLGLQSPDRWDTVVQEAYRLRGEAKPAEAAALLEKTLAAEPRGDGHLLLGLVYEELAAAAGVAVPPDGVTQRARLTQAVEQFSRALDLIGPDLRFSALYKLVDLHRPSGLDRPDEAASFAARLVDAFPTRAEAYMLHGQVLHEQGRLEAAAETLRQGRARVTDFPVIAQLEFARYVIEHIESAPGLPRPAARAALDEILAAMDGVIATTSTNPGSDHSLAVFVRKTILRTIAERVEEDPVTRAALLAEADQTSSAGVGEAMAFVEVPAGPTVTGAGDALEQALLGAEARATGAWDQGRHAEAVQVLADFADAHPEYARAHLSLGYRHTDRAGAQGASTPSPAQREGYLRLAAAAFERALSVSQPLEIMYAVEHLITVYGPDALKEPDRAIGAAREGIRQAPAHPRTHGLLARALLDAGREDELAAAFDAARTGIPPDQQVTLANEYLALVGTAAQSSAANARLVQVSETLIDAALARNADDLFASATKEWALRERAARVEQDAARAAALVQEADRVAARVRTLRSRTP